jgi:cytochrome o ubiquinol oxidase subunit 2
MVVMSPSGDIARQQADLIIVATVLMLLIIVPVLFLTLYFAWYYRHSNKKAKYDPEWHHSTGLEVVIWSAPLAIIIALGAITWISTHKLDPYRPLDRIDANRPVTPDIKPISVEVVALDWKWLFFYPEYGIATVNELAAPVDVPINFKLTGSSVMNAFYVPALAGMIYTMPGMQTKLHAVINEPGTYDGLSANYSGEGFTDMRFKFLGLAQDDFDQWVARVKQGGSALNRDTYLKLEKPSIKEPVRYYSSVQEGLYRAVLNMCALEGQMCMDEMMHIDKMGGAGVDSQENRARLQYDNRRATESVEETGDSSDAAAPSTSTPARGSDAAEVIDINATPSPSSMNQSMQGMQHPTTTGSDASLQAIGQLENDASAKP